jgi:hypothetical protein
MTHFAKNHLLPQDTFGVLVYIYLAFITVLTYLCRYVFSLAFNYGPLGLLGIFCLPLILLPIIGGLTLIYLWKSKNPVPLLGFFPLFALAAYFLPLAPMPPSAEEKHFKTHRTEYNLMINQAKQGQLNSANSKWEAEVVTQNPLVVTFSPLGFYGVIAYADRREDLRSASGCGRDGAIYRQLDKDWWLCYHEWN